MGRFVPQSLSPKTTQVRKPGIRNTRSVEHMLKVFSVKVRITSRAGIRSDVGKEFDSSILQQSQECLAVSVTVADGVESGRSGFDGCFCGHDGNIAQNVPCLLVTPHCRSCGHYAIESVKSVGAALQPRFIHDTGECDGRRNPASGQAQT